jgi:hypothetical protein
LEVHLAAQRLEEPFELGYNVAFDVPTDSGERAESVHSGGWSSIAERYVAGEMEIHLHFRLSEMEMTDFCVVFENAADGNDSAGRSQKVEVGHERTTGASFAPTLGYGTVGPSNRAQTLVPIYAGEFVEDVKFVVPSLVRLQLLDSCLHCYPLDFTDFVHPASGAVPAAGVLVGLEEGGFSAVDGEAGRTRRLAPLVLEGEPPHEVFERGPHVLEGVTDDDAQKRRRLLKNLRPEDVLATVRVGLVGDSIRLSGGEGGKFVAEHFQVLARPKQLEAGSSEGIGHGKW